jgi:hypothetical protein
MKQKSKQKPNNLQEIINQNEKNIFNYVSRHPTQQLQQRTSAKHQNKPFSE